MAVNRYDSPAQDRYFNTYVPLPFEQMMPVAAARLSQLQRGQDMLNKTYEDTANLEYIADSKDEAYVKDYLGKTGNLVDKYISQDLSDPIVGNQMRSEFRKMTDRTRLQNIGTSAANWKQNLKGKAQLEQQGFYDKSIDEDPAVGWDSSKGVYQYTTPAYKNPRPAAEPYFNNMEASDYSDKNGVMWRGITKSDINRVAEAKWGDFADTSEGRLYIKKIAKEQGIDPNDKVERKRIAMEYLKGVGEEKVHAIEAPGQTGGRTPKSSEAGAFNPFKTPTINTPSESVLGNKKYTANRVYKRVEELDSEIKTQETALQKLIDSGANEETITQAKLNLQSSKENYDVLNKTVESAKSVTEERYKPAYDEAMNKYVGIASKKGVSKDEAIRQYETYAGIEKVSKDLQWSLPIKDDPTNLFRLGTGTALDVGNSIINIVKGLGEISNGSNSYLNTIRNDPNAIKKFTTEFARFKEGEISWGQALRNSIKESREYYKDSVKSVPLDKESRIFVDKKIRDDVVKHYNSTQKLDARKQKDIDEMVETGGLKSKAGVAILPIPSGVDEYGQMYVIGRDKGKVSDKSIESISTLARQIKDNPNAFALIQESGVSKDSNKPKNQEIEDLQNSIRSSDYILPTHYLPHRNDDGTYDMSFTTYHKPAKGEKPVATRVIKVKLNRSDQIESVANLINEAGYPATAARVANPDIDRTIKSNLSSKEIKVEPYPGFGEYTILKQGEGWKILYPDGTPILSDSTSGEEVGTLNNIEDVIDYLYQVRIAVSNKANVQQ
jgi:hypothetical protein